MLADTQVTELDQGGAVGDEVTADQVGSPERLGWCKNWWMRVDVYMICTVPD